MMLIVGANLKELCKKHNIVDNLKDVEETCIQLKLDKIVKHLCTTRKYKTLRYGETIPDECIKKEELPNGELILKPNYSVLACSSQKVNIPRGYMGLVQTKGSLARLFVFAQCSDAQVDGGFSGKITFELYNASKFQIIIKEGQEIVNLYIVNTSDKNSEPYIGKYCNANEPTIQLP